MLYCGHTVPACVARLSCLNKMQSLEHKVRPYVQYQYVILPYVNRTLTSLYDENKLYVSYLQPKFTKVSTDCVIDLILTNANNKTTNRGLVQVIVTVTQKICR